VDDPFAWALVFASLPHSLALGHADRCGITTIKLGNKSHN